MVSLFSYLATLLSGGTYVLRHFYLATFVFGDPFGSDVHALALCVFFCNTWLVQHTATHFNTLNTLQHTATRCNTLQHNATHDNTLQHTATHCNTLHTLVVRSVHRSFVYASTATLQHTATRYNTLQHATTHCNTPHISVVRFFSGRLRLLFTATHCTTLQQTATHCDILQHIATHCNILEHTATYCNML